MFLWLFLYKGIGKKERGEGYGDDKLVGLEGYEHKICRYPDCQGGQLQGYGDSAKFAFQFKYPVDG